MSTDGVNNVEDAEMAECDGDKVVTMMEVLQEQQEFEDDANAVLGASDDKNCTYPKGYIKRQALYACLTCCSEAKVDPTKRAGVCLACSLTCHENHELVELYTKRNFRCDCGNPKFNSHPCQFTPDKTDLNEDNIYNQNFSGLYCTCHRPYPDPESTFEDDMIQCIICEDWLHASHLDAVVPGNDHYSEMICKRCMEKNEFLHDYSLFAVNNEIADVDVTTVNGDSNSLCNGESEKEVLVNGIEEKTGSADVTLNGDVDMNNVDGNCKEADNTESDRAAESTVPESNEETSQNDSSKVEEESIESKAEENKMDLDAEESKNESSTEKDTETSEQEKIDESSTKEEDTKKESARSEEKQDVTDSEQKEPQENTEEKSDNAKVPEEVDTASKELTETSQESSDQKASEAGGDGDHIQESSNNQSEAAKDDETEQESKEHSETPDGNVEVPDTSQSEQTEKTNTTTEQNEQETVDKPDKTDSNEKENDAKEEGDSVMDAIDELLSGDEKSKQNEVTSGSANKEHAEFKDNEVEMDAESKNTDGVSEKSENTTGVNMSDNKSEDETNTETKEANGNAANPDTSEPAEESKTEPNETETTHKTDSANDSEPVTNENKLPNGNQDTSKEHKRKLSTELSEDISTKKAKVECMRPRGVKRIFKGATFWPSNFRQKLCTCGECISMYKDLKVLFLTDPEDTVSAYESLGKENIAGCASQYEKGLQALSSLDRIQQINALTEYNKMRDKLLDFLKSFKDRKEVVKEEDIKAFFAGMKPRREPDGVYFCR